jgi:alginate O-acetyltransferase complex protein AlgJ
MRSVYEGFQDLKGASPVAAKTGQRARGWAVVLLLGIFLSAPLIVTAYNLANHVGSAREEARAPAPRWSTDLQVLKKLPGASRWYFTERYGLKDTLMFLHGILMVKLLGASASSAVLLGKSDWLFLASERVLDYQRGAEPLSAAALEDWVDTLERRHNWLADQGIDYAFVVAPNTHTIYPEFLPTDLAKPGLTRLDQLVSASRAAPQVRLIDLRPALLRHKAEARLYFKTDTHWNPIGAWFATQEIAARLALPLDQGSLLPLRSQPLRGGDLARLLGLQQSSVEIEQWPAQVPPELTTEAGRPLSTWQLTDVQAPDRLVVRCARGKGTALIFRDSFGEALIPWLSAAFEQTIWIRSYEFSEELVQSERPDVVIEQVVERKLMHMKRPGGGLDE